MLAAGSRYETSETNGIAHFAEHMFFKGTEHRPTARDIGGEIDAIGGEFNAFTGKEYTGYYVKCAAEHRGVALDVLVDMLRHSKFARGGDRAREGRDHRGDEHVLRHAARLHRRGVRATSSTATSRSAGTSSAARKRCAARRARRSWTTSTAGTSRRAWSSASGRRDRRRPAREVEELLRRPRAAPRPGPAAGPLDRTAAAAREGAHEAVRPGAPRASASRAIPLTHPDRYTLQVLATVLGGGMSSRLFTEVRERRGLAYYVYGVNHSYTDAGSLYAQAGVDINRIDEAVTTIAASSSGSPRRRCRQTSSRRRGTSRRVASCCSSRARRDDHVRASARGARGAGAEPTEVLAGLDAVTVRTCSASRRRSSARGPTSRDRPVRGRRAVRAAARGLTRKWGIRVGP